MDGWIDGVNVDNVSLIDKFKVTLYAKRLIISSEVKAVIYAQQASSLTHLESA